MSRILTRYFILGLAALAIVDPVAAQNSAEAPFRPAWQPPSQGMVPDAETAVKVGTAVLSAMGPVAKSEAEQYRPWSAQLAKDGNWEVRGTLPRQTAGGTFVVVVAKRDGRIIIVYHEE